MAVPIALQRKVRLSTAIVLLLPMLLVACTSSASEPSTPPEQATGTTTSESGAVVEGMYDVGGHRLFMQCRGTGSPTIVFLHGVGGRSSDWDATLAGLTDLPTCNYDRLNVGRSDVDPGRHDVDDSDRDLEVLLDVAGIDPPYVLVAHSFGGMIALSFAATHPDEVAGILLVDATLPLEADLDPPKLVGDITAELDDNDEHVDFYEAFGQVGAELDRLPAVPITYLFGTQQELAPEWKPGAYVEALHAFIDGLPHGRLVEEQAGHSMPLEIPDEIAAQTRAMLDELDLEDRR